MILFRLDAACVASGQQGNVLGVETVFRIFLKNNYELYDGIRIKFVTISSCTVWHDSVNNCNRIELLLEQIFTLLLSNIIPQEEDNTCVTQCS